MNLEIEPLIGFGSVTFNMTRASVYAVLGAPEHINGNSECFLSCLMVDFDEAGIVEFIEMARSKKYVAVFHGHNLHGISANEAVELISRYDKLQENDTESGYSYIFPQLQLSLWRGTMPEDESDEDGKYFQAVGVARDGYFDT